MSRLGVLGVTVTFLYLGGIFFFQREKILEIGALELNAFGDFLAGTFGPLAIFWLVLGFFQQGAELKNSVATLKLQAEELRNSVKAQSELVEVAREQLYHDMDHLRSELRTRKNSLQPRFSVALQHSSGGPKGTKYRLRVTNIGHRASSVSVGLEVNGNQIWHGKRDLIETGDTIEYVTDHLSRTIDEAVIEISYVDAEDTPFLVSKKLEPEFSGDRAIGLIARIEPTLFDTIPQT